MWKASIPWSLDVLKKTEMSGLVVADQNMPDFLRDAGLSALTKQLAGRAGAKRIVPKNGIFRKMVGGEEMGKVKGSLNVVIANASPHEGVSVRESRPATRRAECGKRVYPCSLS